ncbi:MAG: aminotransferase class III-fold pyridoxal phosphate-dependent enzyme [Candidatus Dormibacteraeota bacterium]|nr:aminotransferase class III-fold pyridoxal phosphate-dependent enzyme [Candidatus Dormibacteraeota bacterium]
MVRGRGCRLTDSDGREYLDLVSNYGVNILGHAHPAITAAITTQAETLTSAHQSFGSPVRDEFVAALGSVVPPSLSRVCFANAGAEALEVAIKLTRAATGRTRIVAMHRGYHGRTMGALSLTADAAYRRPFLPLLPGVSHIAFDDVDALDTVDDSVAAVVVEPIQGEAGVRVPDAGYLAAVRRRCSDGGALLVADEVQSGFRTGTVLATIADGVTPDVLCMGKGIANGLPMAVTLCTEQVAASMPRGGHGSTFAGSPLVCAAATATMRLLADGALHANVTRMGERTMARLRLLPPSVVREVRGRGLMIGIELRRPAMPAIIELQSRGLLVLAAGSTVIRLLPPLIIDDASLEAAVATIFAVLG